MPMRENRGPGLARRLSEGPTHFVLICWECRRAGGFTRDRLVARFGDVGQHEARQQLNADCAPTFDHGTVPVAWACRARWLHDLHRAKALGRPADGA